MVILTNFWKINTRCACAGSASILCPSSRHHCSALLPVLRERHLVEKIIEDDSSWFGSNPSFRLHLREIPQLMESYPQLIPNMNKVVESLKAYKMRHSHGEGGENNKNKYFHSDHGYFKQGVGQGGLGEVGATASTDCKYLVMFSLIYAWPISFKFVYCCIYLSIMDKFSLN
jgi:hypothetical protein